MHMRRPMHNLPTPPEEYDDLGPVAHLIQPTADLSLGLSWIPAFSAAAPPPSYDPTSPSYDPCAASPCNPFPSSSPFSTFTFTRPRAGTVSRLRFEDVQATPQPQTPSQAQPQQPSHSQAQPQAHPHPFAHAAFSRIPPPHSAPSLRRTKPCRFFLSPAGCKTGRWCNFKHPVGGDGRSASDGNAPSNLDALRAAVIRSRKPNTDTDTASDPDSAWDGVPDVRDVDPDWGKKPGEGAEGDVHPKWRSESLRPLSHRLPSLTCSPTPAAQPCRNFLLGLCRYGPKCQFIHPPGLYAPAPSSTSAATSAASSKSTATPSYPTSLPLPLPVAPSATVNTAIPPTHGVAVPVSVWGAHPGVGAQDESLGKAEQMSLYYRSECFEPCVCVKNRS
jgi:hypothetical protein